MHARNVCERVRPRDADSLVTLRSSIRGQFTSNPLTWTTWRVVVCVIAATLPVPVMRVPVSCEAGG